MFHSNTIHGGYFHQYQRKHLQPVNFLFKCMYVLIIPLTPLTCILAYFSSKTNAVPNSWVNFFLIAWVDWTKWLCMLQKSVFVMYWALWRSMFCDIHLQNTFLSIKSQCAAILVVTPNHHQIIVTVQISVIRSFKNILEINSSFDTSYSLVIVNYICVYLIIAHK